MTYRVFTNDVGPSRYSALRQVNAGSLRGALEQAARGGLPKGTKILCIPEDRMDLMPNGQSGRVKAFVERVYGATVG
jgi:hypothetical protein